ncbi:hypothetical protein Tco_1212761 [Tanacetum coccineum]
MENETRYINEEKNGGSKQFEEDFEWFNNDTPFGKWFDEFYERWRGKNEKTIKSKNDDGWSGYLPNLEWKLLEQGLKNPSKKGEESIGEYELMINDEDFEWMFDYFLAKDAPSFMLMRKKSWKKRCTELAKRNGEISGLLIFFNYCMHVVRARIQTLLHIQSCS